MGPGRYAIAEWRECLGPSGTGHRHALRRPYRVGVGRRDASRLLTVTAVTPHSFVERAIYGSTTIYCCSVYLLKYHSRSVIKH